MADLPVANESKRDAMAVQIRTTTALIICLVQPSAELFGPRALRRATEANERRIESEMFICAWLGFSDAKPIHLRVQCPGGSYCDA